MAPQAEKEDEKASQQLPNTSKLVLKYFKYISYTTEPLSSANLRQCLQKCYKKWLQLLTWHAWLSLSLFYKPQQQNSNKSSEPFTTEKPSSAAAIQRRFRDKTGHTLCRYLTSSTPRPGAYHRRRAPLIASLKIRKPLPETRPHEATSPNLPGSALCCRAQSPLADPVRLRPRAPPSVPPVTAARAHRGQGEASGQRARRGDRRTAGERSPLQTGELGLFLSGELLPCSGDCRRCRTLPAAVALPSGSGDTGEEHGEGPQPSGGGGGGGGKWCGRGGLPRGPAARVGLPREEAAEAAEAAALLPPPPGVCVAMAGPPRPPLPPPVGAARVGLMLREAGAARGRLPLGALAPPPLRVGLPCCCCCCLSWKGTVALMGCRRLPAPIPPPAAAAPPPPREVAGIGEPLRLMRWWDIVRWEPELAEGSRRLERKGKTRGTGRSSRGSNASGGSGHVPCSPPYPVQSNARYLRSLRPLINNSAPAARAAPRALPLAATPLGSRSYGAPIGCAARS